MLQAGLALLNSLNFCLSVKLLNSPSNLNEIFARYSNRGYRFSLSVLYTYPAIPFWPVEFLLKDPLLIISVSPCMLTCCFSLDAFSILSLCLISVSLINVCLNVFVLEFNVWGALCASWT